MPQMCGDKAAHHLNTVFIFQLYHWTFMGPGVDSASNRNEYQEYLLGVKAAGA
jgi:hypothetical protein